ncbi:hypothetical protein EVAR_78634_1 [Eumeta japonica]|uniref:Uncharacterized protein n=1 Tax=Eumeta variegata TaxID=151549 RepID=A0A4C1U824_EUMVA|nr:hypothetical protein EVAR_78634_1 [Eumeta japonica]
MQSLTAQTREVLHIRRGYLYPVSLSDERRARLSWCFASAQAQASGAGACLAKYQIVGVATFDPPAATIVSGASLLFAVRMSAACSPRMFFFYVHTISCRRGYGRLRRQF